MTAPIPFAALSPADQSREIDDMARRIVSQDVRYCVSGLITFAMADAFNDGSMLSEDDAYTLSNRAPDAGNYRDAVPHGETVTVMRRDDDGHPGSGLWEWFGPNADSVFTDEGGKYPETELAAWESAFEANGWDKPEGSEIFEHWLVTDDLARRLKAQGESVADDVVGMTVWGRSTTGQAIYADAVFQTIARDILEA